MKHLLLMFKKLFEIPTIFLNVRLMKFQPISLIFFRRLLNSENLNFNTCPTRKRVLIIIYTHPVGFVQFFSEKLFRLYKPAQQIDNPLYGILRNSWAVFYW